MKSLTSWSDVSPVSQNHGAEPLVSVVIATHNRPLALRQAINSVIGQTLQDWELIVVGDGCRPDTPAAVAEFHDPRISYIDLPVNFGEQSGPNNLGMARARGRYIAFLNHDDLWFPDHLAALTGWIEASGADIATARGASVKLRKSGQAEFDFVIMGGGRNGRYDPGMTLAVVSTWLLRRSARDEVGPWRPAAECVAESSQDWLFRAWRKGLVIATMPHLTVLMPHSGERPGSYVGDHADEQIELLAAMTEDPDALRLRVVENATEPKPIKFHRYWKRRFYAAIGIDPRAKSWRRNHGRGSFIQHLRRERGLPPLPARDPDLEDLQKRYRARSDQDPGAKD
jgi:glycosyltransferase involved in cell wall biosynthesis